MLGEHVDVVTRSGGAAEEGSGETVLDFQKVPAKNAKQRQTEVPRLEPGSIRGTRMQKKKGLGPTIRNGHASSQI